MTDIVSLTDVRAHLRIPAPSTSDDLALQGFIDAAGDVIRAECGDIIPTDYDEYHDGGSYAVYVRHRPILSIINVEEGWGWANYELDFQQVNTMPASSMFAYSIDRAASGEISRRTAGNVRIPFVPGSKNIRVQYIAGRAKVPGAVRLAALELIAHWWQSSQLRSASSNATFGAYDAVEGEHYTRAPDDGLVNVNVGIPYRVLELLKPYRHMPYMA